MHRLLRHTLPVRRFPTLDLVVDDALRVPHENECSGGAGGDAGGGGVSSRLATGAKVVVNFDTLLYAVQNGDVFLVQTWIHTVGDMGAEILNNNPALLNRAVFSNNEKMVELLLEAKARCCSRSALPRPPSPIPAHPRP